MDNQELIKVINGLKEEKYIYNDADLCRKLECSKAFLSELKAGKRPITEQFVARLRNKFPDFFAPKTARIGENEPTLGEVARMIADHDRRFHDQMERIMDAMGIAPKKVASM
jgi:hypothetical protein